MINTNAGVTSYLSTIKKTDERKLKKRRKDAKEILIGAKE